MAKWIVVGAGLTGATIAERIASVRKEEVLVIEKLPYVGGACADHWTHEGLLVQKCGPHVFHTNLEDVWGYLQPFAKWLLFRYQVHASVESRSIPLPIGLIGIDLLFPDQTEIIKTTLLDHYQPGEKVSILRMLQESNPIIARTARSIYDRIFQGYTMKHWGILPEELDSLVVGRVPIIIGDQDSYTGDKYQAVPTDGFSNLVTRMLDHPKITVKLSHMCEPKYTSPHYNVIYTGAIDEYFSFELGPLPYRSVQFKTKVFLEESVLPVATITYPLDQEYTRATEMKKITQQAHKHTAVVYEYPSPCSRGLDPLYPVPKSLNYKLYQRYVQRSNLTQTLFCGRLGEYRYFNMDQAIKSALHLVEGLP
jgi:UDP-galactopyranose mutase